MAVASIAGIAAASAYLDAKFHIRKDIESLLSIRQGRKKLAAAVAADRVSTWYLFEAQCKLFPANVQCIWSRQHCYTWHETYTLACRWAKFLRAELGVQPGELVALDCQNCPEFMLAWLGMWGIGAAPALINYNLEGEGLVHCLRISGAKVVLVDEDETVRCRMEAVKAKVEGELGMRIVVLNREILTEIQTLEAERPPDVLRNGIQVRSHMALLFTSGTTGFPKAVSFPFWRAWISWGSKVERLGIKSGSGSSKGRWYQPMPLYHGTGGLNACRCLCSGITVCIGRKFSVTRFWSDIRASEATAFTYVGETARYLLSQPESVKDKQHNCTMMYGNGMRPDVWRRFTERFGIETVVEFFNSSEGVFGLLNICKGDFLATAVGHHGLIMRTMFRNTYVPVSVDYDSNEILRRPLAIPETHSSETPTEYTLGFATRVPYTTGGEILVRMPTSSTAPSATGFAGYHNNPTATAQRFATSVFRPGDLYYRSGDALRRDQDGRWYFLDRLGDTFRWKSENVSTAEVAEAIGRFPGVVEGNVYGVLVPGHDGRAGCAAVYLDPSKGSVLDFKQLHAHLTKTLPRYAVPLFLRVQSSLRTMHNQKQNKVPLRNEGVDPERVRSGHEPGDSLLWCPPGGNEYVSFGEKEWELLTQGRAKL